MPEADVLYSDVTFTKTKDRCKEMSASADESTYSEVKTMKSQPSAQQPGDSQQKTSSKRLQVTERASLVLLCVFQALLCGFLAGAVIGLAFNDFQTKERLQTIQNENEALRKNLSETPSKPKVWTTEQPAPVKTTVATFSCHKCEEGWEPNGGACYYFSSNTSTWNRSREECKRRGGDLVKIESREEQAFLEKRTREKIVNDNIKFWFGMTDSKKEGEWLWVDGSPLNTSLAFWISTEPDNSKGNNNEFPEGENCGRMGMKAGAADLKCWFDRDCNAAERLICEKPAETGQVQLTCV